MNIYGDWGNTLVLARRAQWQGYDVELLSYDPGDELPGDVDILVGGGGQDSGQDRIKEDLVKVGPTLKAWRPTASRCWPSAASTSSSGTASPPPRARRSPVSVSWTPIRWPAIPASSATSS